MKPESVNPPHYRPRLLVIDKVDGTNPHLNILQDRYEVMYADNFDAGFSTARQLNPALVIINPFLEGDHFGMPLKRKLGSHRVPVLAILPTVHMSALQPVPMKGWDDFIRWPCDEVELLFRVHMMLLNRLQLHARYINFIPDNNDESADERFLKKIKDAIEDNLDNSLFGVGDLAFVAGVSKPQLYRRLILLTGFSPNHYIRHIRLKHAARLLSDGVGNVSEIAYRVGFSSHSYFAKCFKAIHQCAPREMLQ